MRQFTTVCCVAALAVLCLPVTVQAATAILAGGVAEPVFYPGGYDGAADNTIYYYSPSTTHPAYPEKWMRTSDGANGQIKAITGSTAYRDLIRFDLSAMAGQGVDVLGDATLTMTVSSAQGYYFDYSLYEIAPANAGWQESTNNTTHNPTSPYSGVNANNGDPTWFYKAIDASLDPNTATAATDTTSVKWASEQVSVGPVGSNPEGYANTGGLWNWIDLVDQDPSTVADDYLDMSNGLLEPVSTGTITGGVGTTVSFTIPEAMIQSWIDNPADNAGFLGRNESGTLFGFWSKETGTAANRPTLTFDYDVQQVIEGDFNGDGMVNGDDLTDPVTGWYALFGTDLDVADLMVWQRNYGTGVPTIAAVPEPTSLALLLVLSACAVIAKR